MPCPRTGNMALNFVAEGHSRAAGIRLDYLEGDRGLDITEIGVIAWPSVGEVLAGKEVAVASPDVEPFERLISDEQINLIADMRIGRGGNRSHSGHSVRS